MQDDFGFAGTVEAHRLLVDALPFPVLLLEADRDDHRVLLANHALHRLLGDGHAVEGRPLAEVLPLEPASPDAADEIGDLLDAVVSHGISGHHVELRQLPGVPDAGPTALHTQWWVTLEPLRRDGRVWAVLATLVDDLAEGWVGTRRGRREVLHELLSQRTATEVYA
ncbi:MAG: PAS domain-containing protein, partial [Egibacteraceae bacterium]